MEDFELTRFITIGQYIPTGSIVHRLDPRTKIVSIGLMILAAAIWSSPSLLVLMCLLVLLLVLLARIDLGFALRGLRPALPILAFLALLQLLAGWAVRGTDCQVLWSWWVLRLTNCSVVAVVALLARLIALFLLTSLLTLTTSISELTHGLESLLRPFQRAGVPSHELAMVFTLALRFVPTLAEELEKILKAQAARGADIRMGSNPVQRTRQLLPVLVPLFLTTLRRSEALIEAMQARGYTGGHGRSHYIRLRPTLADAVALAGVALLLAGMALAPFGSIDAYWLAVLAGRPVS